MKVTLLFQLFLVALNEVSGILSSSEKTQLTDVVDNRWSQFKMQYGREYSNSSEETRRFNLFHGNIQKLDLHNEKYEKGETSFKVRANEFIDMRPSRGRTLMTQYKMKIRHNKTKFIPFSSDKPIPKHLDWRDKKVITAPMDQSRCASCWAFSAVGSIEAQRAIKHGNLTPLSAQHLIDCSNSHGNEGCKGGQPDNAYEFVIKNGGMISEANYPYTGTDSKCQEGDEVLDVKMKDYWQIPEGDEDTMQRAVAENGPVACAFNAGRWAFHHYYGGIYDDPNCTDSVLDHSVLVVGYGSEGGKDYWIVRNSWGKDWGEEGYFKLKRGSNQCGIATMSSYPIIK